MPTGKLGRGEMVSPLNESKPAAAPGGGATNVSSNIPVPSIPDPTGVVPKGSGKK